MCYYVTASYFVHVIQINHSLNQDPNRGPVVQNIVTLTSSLVVKMLSVLVSIIFNSQLFLLKNKLSSFFKCKLFFSANILAYMPYVMIKVLTIR